MLFVRNFENQVNGWYCILKNKKPSQSQNKKPSKPPPPPQKKESPQKNHHQKKPREGGCFFLTMISWNLQIAPLLSRAQC